MSKAMSNISRRSFVKTTGALGALAVAGGSFTAADSLFRQNTSVAYADVKETTTWGHCAINCPGRCSLKFHVKDDEVTWVETYTSKDASFDDPQPRACLRGRTYRRWMNSPDRINYPMKRVGSRGDGKYKQISWDEAIEISTTKLKEVIEKYGNEAVFHSVCDGCFMLLPLVPFYRLMAQLGGYLKFYGRLFNCSDNRYYSLHVRKYAIERINPQYCRRC